jgi:tRNA nucleotidyltransferase (CCA-adding enzyme)
LTTLRVPGTVRDILHRLEKAGHETWCVGGAIRDALLGEAQTHRRIDALDWDLATAARPEEIRRLFRRTVPVGIAFGTVGVLDTAGIMHEVTTFRRDVKTDGRHAVVEFGNSIEDDLARRDFTFNAIAYHPDRGDFHDPYDGKQDLERGIVRAVGVAGERMREDRLRALRGIRFAARLKFEIEPDTWQAILDSSPHMGRLSAERVKQEIEKTMDQVECPSSAFAMWQSSGAFATLIPALARASAVDLATIDQIALPVAQPVPGERLAGLPVAKANRRILRLIALFASLPPGSVLGVLRDLRFSNADAGWISAIVGHWSSMRPEMRFALADGAPPDSVLRRWAAITGRTRLASVMRLAAARWSAERVAGISAPRAEVVRSTYRRAIRVAYRDPVEVADLAINGSDLARLGIRGPAVGQMLRKLLETVITDPGANTRDSLLKLARGSSAEPN